MTMPGGSTPYVFVAAIGPVAASIAESPELIISAGATSILATVAMAFVKCVALASKHLESAEKHRELEVKQWAAADQHRATEVAYWAS